MAMLPFIGYHVGDYFQHWIEVGKSADAAKLPRIYFVNWFRKGDDGRWLWPGFGENSRVLEWIIRRIEGTAEATETPIGYVPTPSSLNTEGLDLDPTDLKAALTVHDDEWRTELPLIEEWFARLGERDVSYTPLTLPTLTTV